jgi:choline dehydrogenase-like flavoprotein
MTAIKNKPVDAVLVGFGWTGAIMAMELTEAGLDVLALERGPARDTYPDFAYPKIADELAYGVRLGLMQNLATETVTVRHCPTASSAPSCLATAWAARVPTGTACTGAPPRATSCYAATTKNATARLSSRRT